MFHSDKKPRRMAGFIEMVMFDYFTGAGAGAGAGVAVGAGACCCMGTVLVAFGLMLLINLSSA
jgi:hypothetical protein